MKALLTQFRGRRLGSGRQLSVEQEQRLQRLLIDKTPDQLKLQYALWTHQAVQQLIKQETGLMLPIRSLGEYLSAGVLRFKSRTSKPKSNDRPSFNAGWTMNIPIFMLAQRQKTLRFTGVMRRDCAMTASIPAATYRKARRLSFS